MNPVDTGTFKKPKSSVEEIKTGSFDDYQKVILDETNFFEVAPVTNDTSSESSDNQPVPSGELKDFTLFGTISGPSSIARALIKKRGEKYPEVFKLWNDVYGYKLVRIDASKVYLKSGEQVDILDMFAKDESKQTGSRFTGSRSSSTQSKQTISRAEIQQKVFNNMDNALKGIRAGPYRVSGKIEGYKLFRVRPNNILYQLGARSGDIVKRVNGHPVDSTEKLLNMWGSIQGDSKITVDIERGGKIQTFDFNITD